MTSEWLGEMFKGDSAYMCAGKFPLVSMWGQANGQACADGERGPPSARGEIFNIFKTKLCNYQDTIVFKNQALQRC
jgi:hypothetical protein